MDKPQTVAEQLDAAQDGAEFGAVVLNLFAHLDKLRDERPAG